MPRETNIYLDIETDPFAPRDQIIVFGLYSSATGTVQLFDGEVTVRRVRSVLPKRGRLFTFNGHAFDLHVIHDLLGLDLRSRYDSHDLLHICRRAGLRGGQKIVERKIGWRRPVAPLGWSEQKTLWSSYCKEPRESLRKDLLRYNRHDLEGMRRIRQALGSWSK